VLMILRTAFTRSELSPRISPISSGVGTGLAMVWVLTLLLYEIQVAGECRLLCQEFSRSGNSTVKAPD
jgi:hypothetical protein